MEDGALNYDRRVVRIIITLKKTDTRTQSYTHAQNNKSPPTSSCAVPSSFASKNNEASRFTPALLPNNETMAATPLALTLRVASEFSLQKSWWPLSHPPPATAQQPEFRGAKFSTLPNSHAPTLGRVLVQLQFSVCSLVFCPLLWNRPKRAINHTLTHGTGSQHGVVWKFRCTCGHNTTTVDLSFCRARPVQWRRRTQLPHTQDLTWPLTSSPSPPLRWLLQLLPTSSAPFLVCTLNTLHWLGTDGAVAAGAAETNSTSEEKRFPAFSTATTFANDCQWKSGKLEVRIRFQCRLVLRNVRFLRVAHVDRFLRACMTGKCTGKGENDGMANTNVRAVLKGVWCGVEQGLSFVLEEGKFTPVGMVVVVLAGVVRFWSVRVNCFTINC